MSASVQQITGMVQNNPRHIAIIMDGNGRWAQKKMMPRIIGHRAGVKAVRNIVEFCTQQGVEVLTLFAFSSENWRRPKEEVSLLMNLFMATLQTEINRLHENNIRLRFIGNIAAFDLKLQAKISQGVQQTLQNTGLTLVIAANYGGRWDLSEAAKAIATDVSEGKVKIADINEALLQQHLALSDLPEPDLFIRTGGEQRISNFLLWQLAYTELYFTETLWPDFDQAALDQAIVSYKGRQRRFGRTGDQVLNPSE
ncbi:MAG: isoprenyl transferase [Methylococcales bacterium]